MFNNNSSNKTVGWNPRMDVTSHPLQANVHTPQGSPNRFRVLSTSFLCIFLLSPLYSPCSELQPPTFQPESYTPSHSSLPLPTLCLLLENAGFLFPLQFSTLLQEEYHLFCRCFPGSMLFIPPNVCNLLDFVPTI